MDDNFLLLKHIEDLIRPQTSSQNSHRLIAFLLLSPGTSELFLQSPVRHINVQLGYLKFPFDYFHR